jgi:hypothetical protein
MAWFTKDDGKRIIIDFILLGLLLTFMQSYYNRKWGPVIAERSLRKENYLNAKQAAYSEAISIINRQFAYTDFIDGNVLTDTTGKRLRGAERPTELEINNCFSKLWVYGGRDSIALYFKIEFMGPQGTTRPIATYIRLIDLIAEDLGRPKSGLGIEDFKYISTIK